jgi:hypothetical protein
MLNSVRRDRSNLPRKMNEVKGLGTYRLQVRCCSAEFRGGSGDCDRRFQPRRAGKIG